MILIDTKLENAAWYYPTPKDAAKDIKDCVAFCRLTSLLQLCFRLIKDLQTRIK